MPQKDERSLVIWRLSDGKPGHEKQTLGLARAVLRRCDGDLYTMRVPSRTTSLLDWLGGRFPTGNGLPSPDLILAAGHATHFALLAARRARGGRAIVLMKPSLPRFLFDLCIIPEHDAPPRRGNVISVRGALNTVATSEHERKERGLFLVGGPSTHYVWDDKKVWAAISAIATANPGMAWWLTTSRRTPASFLSAAAGNPIPNIQIFPHEKTAAGWLEEALAGCARVWVTEDSVSMLYEALTSGAAVGVLPLAGGRSSRVGRGVESLIREGWITAFDPRRPGMAPPLPPARFNEAERVADLVLERFAPEWVEGRVTGIIARLEDGNE